MRDHRICDGSRLSVSHHRLSVMVEEIKKDYENFFVKIIQLYFNDDYEVYQEMKEEDITDKVCI